MVFKASFFKIFVFKIIPAGCAALLIYLFSGQSYYVLKTFAVMAPFLLPALLSADTVEINRKHIKIRGLIRKKDILFTDVSKFENFKNRYIKFCFKNESKPFKFDLFFFKNAEKQTIFAMSEEFSDPAEQQAYEMAEEITGYENREFVFNKTEKHSSYYEFLKIGLFCVYLIILFSLIRSFTFQELKAVLFDNLNGLFLFSLLLPAAVLYVYDKNASKKTITLDGGMIMLWKNNTPVKSVYLKDISFLDADYKSIFWKERGKKASISIMGLSLQDRLDVIKKIKNISAV